MTEHLHRPYRCEGKYDSPRDRVEQAIARGWDVDRIVTELGITFEQLETVRKRMDNAVEENV